jgi:AcrR family transcriptional regulator
MTQSTVSALDTQRRQQILDAAFYCFLQYGFSKTSMDDVAKKADMSRPAIYLKFKNKIDLFHGMYLDLLEQTFEKAELLLKQSLPKREKLTLFCEAIILEPWDKIAGHPRAPEFYELCEQYVPKEAEKFERQKLKIAQTIFNDRETAEVFLMSLEGFYDDIPTTSTLRKRIVFLIDRFTR